MTLLELNELYNKDIILIPDIVYCKAAHSGNIRIVFVWFFFAIFAETLFLTIVRSMPDDVKKGKNVIPIILII